jgi:hypothetical protein
MHEDAPNQFNDDRSLSTTLLVDLRQIIDRCKAQVVVAVNSTLTLTYWHVGQRINADVYRVHAPNTANRWSPRSLAEDLVGRYGKSFEARNLRRMMQFAEVFADFEIVSPLVSQLSWGDKMRSNV